MLSGGCAVNPALRIAEAAPQAGPLRVEVPFHPQTGYQCGPAALGTVLGASGVETSPEALAPQVYLPGRRGSLQLELVAATRRAGRIPYVIDGTPQALFAELAQGRPVLVLQNLWVRTVPRWHYAVLVGADPARNRVLLNSGNRKGLEMRAPAFLRTWDWAGRWAMVALRPGELPADADPARYFAAVADFEEVAGTQAAEPAWRAALAAWPQDHRPRLALGNQAYAAGDLPAAVRHYREGLRLPPTRCSATTWPACCRNWAAVPRRAPCWSRPCGRCRRRTAGVRRWSRPRPRSKRWTGRATRPATAWTERSGQGRLGSTSRLKRSSRRVPSGPSAATSKVRVSGGRARTPPA